MWTSYPQDIFKKKNITRENNLDSILPCIKASCLGYNYEEITYVFDKLDPKLNITYFNKVLHPKNQVYKIYKPSYEIFNNRKVNCTDNLGFKQGIWIFKDSLKRVSKITYYHNNINTSAPEIEVEYHPNNSPSIIWATSYSKKNFMTYTKEKFDSTGVLVYKSFYGDNNYYKIESTKVFNPESKLITKEKSKAIENPFVRIAIHFYVHKVHRNGLKMLKLKNYKKFLISR